MNKKIKAALSILAISPMAAVASPLAYPAPHQWHFTFGAETGVENYQANYKCHSLTGIYEGSNYAIGFSQSVGYGNWFYMQAKESGSIGVVSEEYNVGGYTRTTPTFLDFDVRAYFPISLSKTYMISLQPQVGFAAHLVSLRSRGVTAGTVDENYTRYRTRAYSPLVGLALGCDVSNNFNFRFGIAFEILNKRSRAQTGPTASPTTWSRLKSSRASLHSTLDLSYKVGDNLDLTGSLDHLTYNPVTYAGTALTTPDFSFMDRFSYKIGVRWNY